LDFETTVACIVPLNIATAVVTILMAFPSILHFADHCDGSDD